MNKVRALVDLSIRRGMGKGWLDAIVGDTFVSPKAMDVTSAVVQGFVEEVVEEVKRDE